MNPILVTGGAQGLGASVCRTLAKSGHDVVVHYRTHSREAETVCADCRALGVKAESIQGDFASQASCGAFTESYLGRFPQTKGLVNNVGNYLIAPLFQTTPQAWQDLFQVNFLAPVQLTQALIPALKIGRGSVVNVGVSGLNGKRAYVYSAAYHISKDALLAYTLSLAKEVAPEGVRINMVSPGFMENAVNLGDPSALPMGRAATLDEVAHLIATFFTQDASYITGQNLEISGAFSL